MINKLKKKLNSKKVLVTAGGTVILSIACFTLIVRTMFKRKNR